MYMKINKTISIDVELAELLKQEDNGSELINRLLRDYYKGSYDKKRISEQVNSLAIEVQEKTEKLEMVKAKAEEMQAEEEERRSKKPRCYNCNSENTLIKGNILICMKCGYEEVIQ